MYTCTEHVQEATSLGWCVWDTNSTLLALKPLHLPPINLPVQTLQLVVNKSPLQGCPRWVTHRRLGKGCNSLWGDRELPSKKQGIPTSKWGQSGNPYVRRLVQPPWKSAWKSPHKTAAWPSYVNQKDSKSTWHRDPCTSVVHCGTLVKLWSQPRCLSVDGWEKKIWFARICEVSCSYREGWNYVICREMNTVRSYIKQGETWEI